MEFDLAMERMEEAVALNDKNPDFQRHLWVVLQGLQMNGRRRSSSQLEERGARDEGTEESEIDLMPPCREETHGNRD